MIDLSSWSERAGAKVYQPRVMHYLRQGLYIVVLYNILILSLPLHDLLWGDRGLVMPLNFPDNPILDAVMILHEPSGPHLYPIFMALPVLGVLLYWWKGWRRVSAILVYVGVMVLYWRVTPYLTGGNYLLHILLFYLIWMDEGEGEKSYFSKLLSNTALLACKVQLTVVYVFTGLYKLAGEAWRSGEAVSIITHVDEFTLPWFEASLANVDWLMAAANYGALIYFFAFPIMVWWDRYRLVFLAIGVTLHIAMGIVLGVMDFSLVMIVAYIALLKDEDITRLKHFLPSKKRAVAHP